MKRNFQSRHIISLFMTASLWFFVIRIDAQDEVQYPRFMDHERFSEVIKFFGSPPSVTAESLEQVLSYHQTYRAYTLRYSQEMTDIERAAANGIRQKRTYSLVELAKYSFQVGDHLDAVTEELSWEFRSLPDRNITPRSVLLVLWPQIRKLYIDKELTQAELDRDSGRVRNLLNCAQVAVTNLVLYAEIEAKSWKDSPEQANFTALPVSGQFFFVRHAGRISEEDVSMWLSLYHSSIGMLDFDKSKQQGVVVKYQRVKDQAKAASSAFHIDTALIVDNATRAELANYFDEVCFQALCHVILDGELGERLKSTGAPANK